VSGVVVASGTTHADYNFEKFVAAVAQFPFFCNVEENKQNTDRCDKQVLGLLSLVGGYSAGFTASLTANPNCGATFDNTCQNWPDVETLEYHWIMKLIIASGLTHDNAVYPAWGPGNLVGPAEWLSFFHTQPKTTTAQKPVFEDSKNVASLLANNPELAWATAIFKWFQPHKVNTIEKVTEISDNSAKLGSTTKYFYVEDSYLTPSYDMWMLGDIEPDNGLTVMFPTSYGGFRGILKTAFGADCHSTVTPTANSKIDHAIKTYNKLVTEFSAGAWSSANKDCAAVAGAAPADSVPRIPKFNRKNYYSPVLTTVEPVTFQVRNFQGEPGQCFNVHIETPFSIFEQDSYARCVALKMKSVYSGTPAKLAAYDFTGETGFYYQF
jgi:hypothetical protein